MNNLLPFFVKKVTPKNLLIAPKNPLKVFLPFSTEKEEQKRKRNPFPNPFYLKQKEAYLLYR
ncbi:hypothetical protein MASR2M15_27670 [Anaerolineales bacterium]